MPLLTKSQTIMSAARATLKTSWLDDDSDEIYCAPIRNTPADEIDTLAWLRFAGLRVGQEIHHWS
jgi:hypothetical protein